MVQLGQALLHHRVFLKPERYAGRAPPEAVFNLLFRRHQQQFPDFRRGLQRGNVHIKQEVEPGISRAAQDAALRLVPGDVDGQLLLAAFEHADDPAFRIPHLSAPVLRGRLQGHFHAVAMPRVAKKAGMDKNIGLQPGLHTVAFVAVNGLRGVLGRVLHRVRGHEPRPGALDGQHAGHNPGLRRLHPFAAAKPDDPAFGLQSVEQVLKRFLVPPGQIKETDQIVEAHGMADFAHQPQHLLNVQPAWDAHKRLFDVRAAGVLFAGPGRVGSALSDGISKIPALAGMFFHRKTFLDVGRKGKKNRGSGRKTHSEEGLLPAPRTPRPHLLELLYKRASGRGTMRNRAARRGLCRVAESGRKKGMDEYGPDKTDWQCVRMRR